MASLLSMGDVAERSEVASLTASTALPAVQPSDGVDSSAAQSAPTASLFRRKSHKQAALRKPLSPALER